MRALAVLSLAAACAAEPTDARPVPTGRAPSSTLVFTSDRDGGVHQLFTLDVERGGPRRLLTTDREDRHPRWSPDGARVAFESAGGGTRDVFVVDADGSGLRRVTSSGNAGQPDWSPDGRRLVYVAFDADGPELRVVDLESGEDDALGVEGRWPDWSPDGTRIAYSALTGGDEDVFVVDADGAKGRRITKRDGEDSRPRWSPDGASLYFTQSSPRTGAADVVARVDADGGTPRPLEDRKALGKAYIDRSVATWGGAPDAGVVACASVRGGNADLYLVDPDTGRARQITDDPAMDQDPDWRPR